MTLALLASLMPAASAQSQVASAATGFSGGITLAPDATRNKKQGPQPTPEPQAAPWWVVPDADSELRLEQVQPYLKAAHKQPAIGLLFSQAFAGNNDNAGYASQLSVYNAATGTRINGQWRRASNPRLLYFVLPAPGRYLVSIQAGLRDAVGHTFNHSVAGPVDVPLPGAD